jgi:hypothetical protein
MGGERSKIYIKFMKVYVAGIWLLIGAGSPLAVCAHGGCLEMEIGIEEWLKMGV